MIGPALREALAAVPKACRRGEHDAAVRLVGGRMAGLPGLLEGLPDHKRRAALQRSTLTLAEGLRLARRLRGVVGYEEPAALLYGFLAGLVGLDAGLLAGVEQQAVNGSDEGSAGRG